MRGIFQHTSNFGAGPSGTENLTPNPWFFVGNQLCEILVGPNFEQYKLIREANLHTKWHRGGTDTIAPFTVCPFCLPIRRRPLGPNPLPCCLNPMSTINLCKKRGSGYSSVAYTPLSGQTAQYSWTPRFEA